MTVLVKSNAASTRRADILADYGVLSNGLLLDRLIPRNVTSARSIVRLTANWTGPCMRVRRKSDDVQADVAFDRTGKVSMSSVVTLVNGGATMPLSQFHGGGNVAVVTHYDQSGRGLHGVPPASGAQPLFINAGQFVTNAGSPPLIAFDGVDDFVPYVFVRTLPHSLIISGSTPDAASAGQPFMVQGQSCGYPNNGAADIVTGPSARQMSAGIALGDTTDDRGKYRTYIARFESAASRLYANGSLIATGDAGADPVMSMLLGRSCDAQAFFNNSYHTIITVAGKDFDPVAVSNAVSNIYS